MSQQQSKRKTESGGLIANRINRMKKGRAVVRLYTGIEYAFVVRDDGLHTVEPSMLVSVAEENGFLLISADEGRYDRYINIGEIASVTFDER